MTALTLVVLGVLAAGTFVVVRRAPRSDRDWAADHAVPADITFSGGRVRIEHLRDFRHRPGAHYEEGYRDVEYALDDVRAVWFVLAPFANRWRGLAHSFLSFELEGGDYVAISVEARREAGENYSVLSGLVRGFEATYVVGTEADLIGLRAARGDTLFLYPSRATPAQAARLFEDMLRRADRLHREPEFYNSLTNNCNTNIRDHVNRVLDDPLPFGWGVLLPGFADAMALERGLLDTDLPIERARERFRIEARAREALAAGDDFSERIREGLPARSLEQGGASPGPAP